MQPIEEAASAFAVRIAVNISLRDARGSTFKVGGDVIAVIPQLMSDCSVSLSELDSINTLQSLSYSLYRTKWADDYPATELLDDLENRSILALSRPPQASYDTWSPGWLPTENISRKC